MTILSRCIKVPVLLIFEGKPLEGIMMINQNAYRLGANRSCIRDSFQLLGTAAGQLLVLPGVPFGGGVTGNDNLLHTDVAVAA